MHLISITGTAADEKGKGGAESSLHKIKDLQKEKI